MFSFSKIIGLNEPPSTVYLIIIPKQNCLTYIPIKDQLLMMTKALPSPEKMNHFNESISSLSLIFAQQPPPPPPQQQQHNNLVSFTHTQYSSRRAVCSSLGLHAVRQQPTHSLMHHSSYKQKYPEIEIFT